MLSAYESRLCTDRSAVFVIFTMLSPVKGYLMANSNRRLTKYYRFDTRNKETGKTDVKKKLTCLCNLEMFRCAAF